MASVAGIGGIGGEVFAAKVQVAVLKKANEVLAEQGEAAIKLIQATSLTAPETAATLDVRA